MKTQSKTDSRQAHVWIVGGGVAGLAAAVFAIRDAKLPAKQVHFLEMLAIVGGSLDGAIARTAHLDIPQNGIAVAPDGSIYLINLHQIFR